MQRQNVVKIVGLGKRFGEKWALKELSLEVERGEIYGIIGPSGAGKSTLIHCLTGLEKPDSGCVYIEGEPISHLEGEALCLARRKMGMIFQHFSLFSSRTALENILYPLEIAGKKDREKGREFLSMVGLRDCENHYPAQLSGGQKQRVAIARALITFPSLLLCDEPTSALDPEVKESILGLLLQLKKELDFTLVLITHEMSVIKKMCTKLALLDEGQIVEKGRALTLLSKPSHPRLAKFLHSFTYPLVKGREYYRLGFVEALAGEPLISYVVKHYPVEVNILQGSIEMLQEGNLGNLLVELEGSREAKENAIAYLQKVGVIVERIAA